MTAVMATTDFNAFRYIFVPWNVEDNHWVLLVADTKLDALTVLDSLGRSQYLWGEQMQEQMPTYPPQPMCYPEDEENIIYPAWLHRMNTNYTLDYIV